MTVSAWPLDAVNGAPTYSGRVLRQTTNAPMLSGATAARPLGGRSGVRPGTSVTTVAATSTTWTCGPVAGVIDGEAAAEAGPYSFASDANVSGTVTAANASNPRVDIVYVQISDPAESDGSAAPGAKIDYLAGSAAVNPAAPATPARSFVLAQINVPKSGGGSPSVTWLAPYTVAAGAVVPIASSAALLALPQFPGAYADLTATADVSAYPTGLYRSDGSSWKSVTGDTGWLTPALQGGNTPNVQYRRISGVTYINGTWVPSANNQVLFTLPAGFRPSKRMTVWCERGSTAGPAAKMELQTGGAMIYRPSDTGTGPVDLGAFPSFPADG